MKMRTCAVLLLGMLVLAGCAQSGGQIGVAPRLCCPGDYANYATFGLATENMPLFLRDYVVAEFEGAFEEKGLTRNDRSNDVRVLLRYNHINLSPEQQEIDPFIRMESMNVELTYVAEIEIEIVETRSSNLVWSGAISRIHQVSPGEYMHEERARPSFRQAFLTVLESYPAR